MIQRIYRFTKETFEIYKQDIPMLLYSAALLKLSPRWIDSPFGYIFFPAMFLVFLRMDLKTKLFVLVFLLPYSESKLLPRQVMGIRGLNPVNMMYVVILLQMMTAGKRFLQPSSFNFPIGVFILLNLISAFFGMDTRGHLGLDSTLVYFMEAFLKPMQIFLCGIIAFNIFENPEDPRHFLRIVKLSSLMLGLWVIYRGGGTMASMRRLASVTGLHKNSVGFMFAVLLAMNLSTQNIGTKQERIFSHILSVIYVIVIMFTFSRQGYVTCVFLLFLHSVRKGFKYAVLFVTGLLMFWYVFVPAEVKTRVYYGTEQGVMMGLKDYTLGDTTAGRKEAWEACKQPLVDNLLFGKGRYTYLIEVRELRPELPAHPHSAYIQILLDVGLVGAFFFIGFYVFLMMKSWFLYVRSESRFVSRYSYGFFLCIVVFFVQAYTGFRFYPNEESYFIWLFLGGLMWFDKHQGEMAALEKAEAELQQQ